jgi:general secretion pathway protein L
MIRYESDDFSRWIWSALDNDNKPTGDVQTGDINALASDAEGKRVVLVIPGHSLLITNVDLPDGNLRTITSAVPYAMEEQIAEDVDNMHFAQGKRQANGVIPVIAISKQYLTDLLQLLADAGIYPAWAVAEPLLLPWKEKELSISINGNTAIVRDDENSGYECSISQLPVLLKSGGDNKDVEAIRVWRTDDDIEISHLFNADEERLICNKTSTEYDCLTEFGSKQPRINILQGFDAVSSMQPSSGSWKPAIILSVVAVLIYFAATGFQYFSLQSEINVVALKTEQLFRETFPDVKRLVKPIVQAQQKLDQRMASSGKAADDLLDLLFALGEAKQKSKSIEFKNLEYRQNSMVVHLEGKSVGQIEEFKQQLESTGNTSTDILSTVSKKGKIEARIKIKAKAV